MSFFYFMFNYFDLNLKFELSLSSKYEYPTKLQHTKELTYFFFLVKVFTLVHIKVNSFIFILFKKIFKKMSCM